MKHKERGSSKKEYEEKVSTGHPQDDISGAPMVQIPTFNILMKEPGGVS